MIVAADRVPAAIIQHVATYVVLDALPDPVTVVSLGAHAPVATFAGRNALRVHVTLGRIGRAIGHHASAVHHAESRIARALVAGARRIVRASFVLQTVGTAAAFVCVCVKTKLLVPVVEERVSKKSRSGQRSFLQETMIAVMLSLLRAQEARRILAGMGICDESMNDRERDSEREE